MKHIRRVVRCHDTRKIVYYTADLALEGYKRTMREDGKTENVNEINVYQCEHCKRWHWGHKNKNWRSRK